MTRERRVRILALSVVLAGALVHVQALRYGAAWDDTRFVFQSGATDGVSAAPDLLRRPYLQDVPPARSPYRPVTAVSYALDWSLGGGQAAFFHWTNLALHMGVTALLMALGALLGLPPVGWLAAGAWFAVHPVHVEAVVNLAGRAELLVAFFGLVAAVLLLLRVRLEAQDRSRPGPVRTTLLAVGSLLALVLALGSKENGVVVAPLLVLMVAAVSDGRTWLTRITSRWRYWLAVGAVLGGYFAARLAVLGTLTTVDVAPFILALPTETRMATAVANWWVYLRLMVAPVDLVVDYGPAVVLPSAPGSLAAIRGLAVGALVAVSAWKARRTAPWVGLGVVWFAVAVLPTSNLLVPIAQWVAERFLYLPSAGAALTVGGAVVAVSRSAPATTLPVRRFLAGAGVVVLLLMAARSWTRTATWENTDTVARTLVEEHPEAFRSQWLLGVAHLQRGNVDAGLQALDSALTLNPGAMELHLERARWLIALGRPDEALPALRRLPIGMHPQRAVLLARALAALGRLEEARTEVMGGLDRFPGNEALQALADSLSVPSDSLQALPDSLGR